MCSAKIVIGCRAPVGCRVDGSVTSIPSATQHRRVAFGPQDRQPFVKGALGFGACRVDALARVGALCLGQSRQCLSRQRQRRAVTEVLGLDPRQRV